MKVAAIVVISGALLLCGCSSNRTYRAGSTGSSGGGSVLPDSTPSLGLPSTLPGSGNSSSYGPGSSGPSLGGPEARQDKLSPRSSPARTLAAPDPKQHVSRYRPDQAAAPVSSADRPSILDEPAWSRFYRSTDRRPIETLILGSGPTHVAIMASLHGDETQSVSLVEDLARCLREHPEYLQNATVLLIKCPNPDGFSSRSPYNIHGVDLNRNFPSTNWKELGNSRAGAKSASEAETRVVVRVLGDFRPGLLVHLKDRPAGGAVNFEGAIQVRAEQVAGMISSRVVEGLGEKTSGSVENYALTRLNCPSLTMLLVREDSDEAAWARNRDALLVLLGNAGAAASPEEKTGSLNEQPDPFEEPVIHKSSLRRPRPTSDNNPAAAGKSRNRTPLPEFPSPVPDHGYLELPPP